MIGCGGSGSGLSTTTTPVHLSIAWAERSRAIQGPSSALSATVTLFHASSAGTDVVFTVDRNTDPASYTQTYTSATAARTGTVPFTIRFYDQAGGAGHVVAEGQENVTITADGGGIGNVTTVNTITQVSVTAGQTIPFGWTQQLSFTARDSSNAIVAVSPGSGMWAKADDTVAVTVTPDGMGTGAGVGASNLKVTVDGITSAAAAVTVSAPPQFVDGGFEMPALTNSTYVQNGDVVGSPWAGTSDWGIGSAHTIWGTFAHDTPQYAFLHMNNVGETPIQGSIHQTVTGLVVGQHYTVSLWMACRNDPTVGPTTGAMLAIYANGELISDEVGTSTTGSFRQMTSHTFTATQTTYDFAIKTVVPQFPEDQATLVDDVKLNLAP